MTSGAANCCIDIPGAGLFDKVLLDGTPGKVNSNFEFFQRADEPFFHVKLFRYLAFDLVKFSPRLVIVTNVVYHYTDSDGIVMKFIVISILFTNCIKDWQKK